MFGDERVQAVLADAGVVVAYLFGSRAQGMHRPDSDADVAVLFGEPATLREQARLAERLRVALDAPDVDLVDLGDASLELRGHVVQEGTLLFSLDEPRRVAFEVRTRSEYWDFLPTLQAHTSRFLRQVAEKGL